MAPKVVKFLRKSKSVRADTLRFTKILTGILEHSRSVNSSSLYGNSKETNFLPILFISKESNSEKLVRMTYINSIAMHNHTLLYTLSQIQYERRKTKLLTM